MKNPNLTKDKFEELMFRHSKILPIIIRTLLKSPNYEFTTKDLGKYDFHPQSIRNALSDLVKEGFLKRIGKRGLYTVYTATIDKETLESMVKEFYGLS